MLIVVACRVFYHCVFSFREGEGFYVKSILVTLAPVKGILIFISPGVSPMSKYVYLQCLTLSDNVPQEQSPCQKPKDLDTSLGFRRGP